MSEHPLDSRNCLSRARSHLSSGDLTALFYAALDLRLGIEARLHEYLDAADQVKKLKARGWQVAKLGKDLERIFKTGDKIASVGMIDAQGRQRGIYYYTPVRKRAKQIAERLGDYLHYTDRTRPFEQTWVASFRSLMNEGVEALEFASTGTLLGPPLLNRATGETKMFVELVGDKPARADFVQIGESLTLQIDYLDELPRPSVA